MVDPNRSFKLKKIGLDTIPASDRHHRIRLTCRNCGQSIDIYVIANKARDLSEIECHCGNRDWSWKVVW